MPAAHHVPIGAARPPVPPDVQRLRLLRAGLARFNHKLQRDCVQVYQGRCLSLLVHSGAERDSPQPGADLSFATRTGTRQGIESHLFRVENNSSLSGWTRLIVQGCHKAVELIKEVTTTCIYRTQECCLKIHYENGFFILKEAQEGSLPKLIWQFSFEKLKNSSDDGLRMLYLDFGGRDGEIQLDLHSCPKPIVFIIHSFLSAKIARLGLLA